MTLNKLHSLFLLLMISSSSFAMMCPTNFKQINAGDTVDQVKQQCGIDKLVSQRTYVDTVSLPQEWTYYLKVNPTDTATLRMTVAFDKGLVTNMSVNGIGVSSTAICGRTAQVGDDAKAVEAACGKPAFVMQGNAPQGVASGEQNPLATKITELNYNTGASVVNLKFENGRLINND